MVNDKNRKIAGIGIITAIVIVLQLTGSFIKLGPFSISLVLVPIVVGSALYGALAGAWLGLVFGITVLLSGDAAPFIAVNVLGTVVTVLLKGTLAGLASGLMYRVFARNEYFSALLASLICPIVNTGLFLVGCLIFFMPTISSWGEALGFTDTLSYMIFGLVGGNFLFEVLSDMLLSPVIVKIIKMGKKD